ncbi:MAG: radical SAM protein [Gemmatimonadota bacterium]|nr:radical SAM protein [Gemmatimonadota bacterium]
MIAPRTDALIRSLRPPKPFVDPFKPHGSLIESERRPGGRVEQALTVFAAGAECPFTCSFCDLWRYSIEGPTPAGALPSQIEEVIQQLGASWPDRFKFYNASNFFDARAVPRADVPRIAALTRSFSAVTVESHASTIGPRAIEFAEQIAGRLEIAVGLETIHPGAMAHLNKRLELSRFDSAARLLRENGIDMRVFVLLGAPYVPAAETLRWTERTVNYAVERGAAMVSIIPVRGGNGEMERLGDLGHFVPPTLLALEAALDASLHFADAVVTADLWDAERLPACEACRQARIARLRQMNLTGLVQPRIDCSDCLAA